MDIRELRKEKGWSQSDLSDLTGLSARTIHRIENGQVKPSVESAKALAAVFELPFSDFMSSSSESPTKEKRPRKESLSAWLGATLPSSREGWLPYVTASFIAVSAYLINDLYSQVGQLSAEHNQLTVAQAPTSDANFNWSEPYKQARNSLEEVVNEYVGYFGERPIPSLLRMQEDVTSQNASVTLLEVSTLRFIARILSMSGGELQRNSDITIDFILDDFLSCYANQRKPITVQSETDNFVSMFSCVDEITSTNGWVLADEQFDALSNLSRSLEDAETSAVRRLLGGSN
jgi:transcriptional regulator with XRE-family HTH domain